MKFIKYILIITSIGFIYSCTHIQETATENTKKIKVGFGPEDIVLDSSFMIKRILISCDARREQDKMESNIYFYNFTTKEKGIINRANEPSGFIFHPHGMDLAIIDSVEYLYVINHRDDISKHQIVKYEVKENELVFRQMFENTLYVSPNDICVYKDGSFWITNDAGKRQSLKEKIFKLKRSTIIYTTLNNESFIAADKLAYANGITYKNNYLYVSTTMQGKLFRYNIEDGKLINRKIICDVKGGDNITWAGNDLLIASHQNFLAYMKHAKNSAKMSPSVIFKINPVSGTKTIVYSNKGNQISAASTAILYKNDLFISQIFDSFILKVSLN